MYVFSVVHCTSPEAFKLVTIRSMGAALAMGNTVCRTTYSLQHCVYMLTVCFNDYMDTYIYIYIFMFIYIYAERPRNGRQ